MKCFYTLFIIFTLSAIFSCSSEEGTKNLPTSPLVELMAPTLTTAIVSAEAAVKTALEKPDYGEDTVTSLIMLNDQLALLKGATALVTAKRANSIDVEQLEKSAKKIHQLRGQIEANIIALKSINAAAAIRLGIVNELAEFCELSAEDISRALSPRDF